ncbi:MAG: mitochondrial fission ELM1 family protein [Sedimenticola sp.]|nr:mitochondrial fission ELM1 family protein [Sedimenticola sp.]MCW8976194.1 mitochondrial fission ELM1 family protein [Sedimenticola sp.]
MAGPSAAYHSHCSKTKGAVRVDERQTESAEKRVVIWRLLDGKPGHENQSLGLCQALSRRINVKQCDIPVAPRAVQLLQWLFGISPASKSLPPPDIVMGAGHMTHFALLAAKRRFAARAVVIMKPSLPLSLFDLCVIPAHDQTDGENVFVTQGVMNTVVASSRKELSQGLILLGGVSSHYDWKDDSVIAQVESIVRLQPEVSFVLSDSRRTPVGFMGKLAALQLKNLSLVPCQQTASGWVVEQLGLSHTVWVSEDSVSMVYEAISSGAVVGLISLKQRRVSRITKGVAQLIEGGWATTYEQWQKTGKLGTPPGTFNEASRCADWMVDQWF